MPLPSAIAFCHCQRPQANRLWSSIPKAGCVISVALRRRRNIDIARNTIHHGWMDIFGWIRISFAISKIAELGPASTTETSRVTLVGLAYVPFLNPFISISTFKILQARKVKEVLGRSSFKFSIQRIPRSAPPLAYEVLLGKLSKPYDLI